MKKRLFMIEDFEARRVGQHQVTLYIFKRERFYRIEIALPHREISMRTGKMELVMGNLSVPSSRGHTNTMKRAVRFGRAVIAAAFYLHEERMKARGVSK